MALCEANGVREERLLRAPHEVEELEMFLYNCPRLRCLDFFPHLRSLKVTQQTISKVEGLGALRRLEELWFTEMQLAKIQGLEGCTQLRRLFLHGNRIRRMEGLGALEQLETLWLADNAVLKIEGLERLARLRELNVAGNKIDEVGEALATNLALERLNLAGNQIGSFKEASSLVHLPRLEALAFSDPLYGTNPLAGLCNYQTYVLFTLTDLKYLDCMLLPEETKQLAEATYMKKKMYYNLRIKTVRSNASNIARWALEGKETWVRGARAMLTEVTRALKDIEQYVGPQAGAEIGGRGSGGGAGAGAGGG